MRYVKTGEVNVGCMAEDMCFGTDGRIWFTHLQKTVFSLDSMTYRLHAHFHDDSFCSYWCDGNNGFIGTRDGKIFLFQVKAPVLRQLLLPIKVSSIGSLCMHSDSHSILFTAGKWLYHVSFEGEMLGIWECKIASCCIGFNSNCSRLWSACDGIEIVDITAGTSIVDGKGRMCPYVNIAIQGDLVACFGGDIAIFDGYGTPIESIEGDYNRGVFGSAGRLLVNEIMQGEPPAVSVSTRRSATGREFDVLPFCDSHAIDRTGKNLVASRGDKIFFFSK